jgi:PleD family two-component response regulator
MMVKPLAFSVQYAMVCAEADGHKEGAMTIRVLIVDDHPFFREGVRNVLTAESDIEIVGEVADGEEPCAWPSNSCRTWWSWILTCRP